MKIDKKRSFEVWNLEIWEEARIGGYFWMSFIEVERLHNSSC